MEFGSKYLAYQVLCRPLIVQKNMVGDVIEEKKPLTAEFAEHYGEFTQPHPDAPGGTHLSAGIMGHYFNSEFAQLKNGWTDEERELVEKVLLRECKRFPGDVWLIEEPKAPLPLPKWDELSSTRRLALAGELNVLAEAVAWEAQNGTDPELLARLTKKLEAEQAPGVESELTVS